MVETESLENELGRLIDNVEKHKNSIRHEYEELRNDYIMGWHRKHGYTKREAENKIQRMAGEIEGHEYALTFLYRRLNEVMGETDG